MVGGGGLDCTIMAWQLYINFHCHFLSVLSAQSPKLNNLGYALLLQKSGQSIVSAYKVHYYPFFLIDLSHLHWFEHGCISIVPEKCFMWITSQKTIELIHLNSVCISMVVATHVTVRFYNLHVSRCLNIIYAFSVDSIWNESVVWAPYRIKRPRINRVRSTLNNTAIIS